MYWSYIIIFILYTSQYLILIYINKNYFRDGEMQKSKSSCEVFVHNLRTDSSASRSIIVATRRPLPSSSDM